MNTHRLNGAGAAFIKYLLLAAFVAALLSGFSGSRMSETSFEDMRAAILSSATLDNMNEGDNQMLRRLYKLEPEDFEGVMLYYPATNMGAEELLVVKLKDRSQQEAVRAAVEARLETQKNTFEGYGPEQLAMLDKAVVEVRGNYVLLLVSKYPEAVHNAFLKAL